ncbi:MAG: CHAT domain-containing protein [Acidobacteriota bacterium]
MSRTTIRIEQLGIENPRILFRVSEPADVPQAAILQELNCDVSVPPFANMSARMCGAAPEANLVRDVGTALYQRLSVHPGVKAALDRIPHAAPNDPCPIYLQLTTPAAEVLPFETLFIPNHRFLALDDLSPIVRVAMANATSGVIERLCKVPLRATVVISAAERNAYEEEEWRALYGAFNESAVDFKLQVLVGRTALRDTIAQTGDPRIDTAVIAGDEEMLARAISEFEPAVLHFFCHGRTAPAAYLEVGNQATHDLGDQPLYLCHDHIRRVSGSLLLVTLNACEGAAPVPDGHSLALAIADRGGVPVVVGMREAVDAQDANLFTGAFYRALLQELHRILSDPGAEPPNWPAVLRAPRDQLVHRQGGPPVDAAAAHKRWSLPVLYVRPEELRLRRTGTTEQVGELQALRSLRRKFSRNSPPEMLTEIDQRIAELEKTLSL